MTTKKLTRRQARQAELLSQYYFKLAYRAGKTNERANALSRKLEDVQAQEEAITQYRTQTLLPPSKVDSKVLKELGIGAVKELASLEEDTGYNSTQLINKLLQENRSSPELEELRVKARAESEGTWSVKNGLLLRYGKLYITDGILTGDMPL